MAKDMPVMDAVIAHLRQLGDARSVELAEACERERSQQSPSVLLVPEILNTRVLLRWVDEDKVEAWRGWAANGPAHEALAIKAFGMAFARGDRIDMMEALFASPWARTLRAKMVGAAASKADGKLRPEVLRCGLEWARRHPEPEKGPLSEAWNRLVWRLAKASILGDDERGFEDVLALSPNFASAHASSTLSELLHRSTEDLVARRKSHLLPQPVLPWAKRAARAMMDSGTTMPVATAGFLMVGVGEDEDLMEMVLRPGMYSKEELGLLAVIGSATSLSEPLWRRLVDFLIDEGVPDEVKMRSSRFFLEKQDVDIEDVETAIFDAGFSIDFQIPAIQEKDGGMAEMGSVNIEDRDAYTTFSTGPYLFAREGATPEAGRALLEKRRMERRIPPKEEAGSRARRRM